MFLPISFLLPSHFISLLCFPPFSSRLPSPPFLLLLFPPFSFFCLQASYFIFITLTLILYQAFQDPNFTPPAIYPWFALTLFLFGHALIPWIYCLSLLFNSATTAFIVIFCMYFFGGFALLIVDSIVFLIAGKVRGPFQWAVCVCVCVCACVCVPPWVWLCSWV